MQRVRCLRLLSRDCDGCSQLKSCRTRFSKVGKGEKVYCADGTAHLVDQDYITFIVDLPKQVEVTVS